MDHCPGKAQKVGDRGKDRKASQKARQIISGTASRTDPNGSYTGIPADRNETPVQDADDL